MSKSGYPSPHWSSGPSHCKSYTSLPAHGPPLASTPVFRMHRGFGATLSAPKHIQAARGSASLPLGCKRGKQLDVADHGVPTDLKSNICFSPQAKRRSDIASEPSSSMPSPHMVLLPCPKTWPHRPTAQSKNHSPPVPKLWSPPPLVLTAPILPSPVAQKLPQVRCGQCRVQHPEPRLHPGGLRTPYRLRESCCTTCTNIRLANLHNMFQFHPRNLHMDQNSSLFRLYF